MKSIGNVAAVSILVIGAGLLVVSQQSAADGVRIDDRVESRWDRREDAVENTVDGVQDRSKFRQERRDCVGDGPDCH
jgi:hypothetical protein